jgi:thioredoxin 1
MVHELTAANFTHEVLESPVPVLVDFWAPLCKPCELTAPHVEKLATEAGGRFRVGKVNAWDEQELAARYRISAVPTILVFKDGAVAQTRVGYQDRRGLLEALQSVLGEPAARVVRTGVEA